MQFTTDLTGLRPEARNQFLRDVVHEDKARYALGALDQLRLKQRADAITAAGYKGDLRAQMVMSQDQWARAMNQYGERCWLDPDFVPWLLKNNEDMRVRDCGTKIMVGYTGAADLKSAVSVNHLPTTSRQHKSNA